jgi:acyl-coenzyme A synthetase/AMP-(fatty) acid ligase
MLTAQKFLPDPFVDDPDARMYRTGDRVRLGADHALEFLGRLDAQVKLRGYRIEPGEIEAALRTHRSISDAAVAVRDHQLVAYLVARHRAPSPSALIDHLRAVLPPHMVPSVFMLLPMLPLTSNGKLDRAALPEIDAEAPTERQAVAR